MTETVEPPAVPLDRLVRVYMKVRTKAQEVAKEYETQLEALKAQQQEVAMAIKDVLQTMGVKSAKTEYGMAILSTKTRYYAQDWDAMRAFILEHQALDLLEKRIAQNNMSQFLSENPGIAPPGLNSVTEFDVSVRKPSL